MRLTTTLSSPNPLAQRPTAATGLVFVGVGGQGILLASEIVARAALLAGHQVKTNEVHGMAQRGGSVMAQVRFGPRVYSPLIAERTARVLVAFEKIEAIRSAHFLDPDGLAIVADHEIVPVTVSSGGAVYPADAAERLRKIMPRLILFNAAKVAQDLGDLRTANVVLVGALSARLDLPLDAWNQALDRAIKPQYRPINQKAFDAGRSLAAWA